MDSIIELIDNSIDEIEVLKKSSNRKRLEIISKWENVFLQNKFVDHATTHKLSEKQVEKTINNSLKMIQKFIKCVLYRDCSIESQSIIQKLMIQLENSNKIINQLKEQINIEKNRAEQYKQKVLAIE